MGHSVDTVIVGGGPAGLSAALILGRCLRSVAIYDDGTPRNYASSELHGFISRDDTSPDEFKRIAREQLRAYPSVQLYRTEVVDLSKADERFCVKLSNQTMVESRSVLLATGILDELPDIPGFAQLFGTSVHSCPYCHGWEERGRKIVV
jgi:thioredoxin reductase